MGNKGAAIVYDKEYYDTQLGDVPCFPGQPDWETHFECVANEIARMGPKTVVEAGCSFGMLVRWLREKHDIDAVGFDISEYAIENRVTEHVRVGDILTPPRGDQRYDLCICIEVLEHLQENEVRLAVENLTRMSDVVLFSSTPDDTETESHYTVKSIHEWDRLFAFYGYWPVPNKVAITVSEHARLYMKGRVK